MAKCNHDCFNCIYDDCILDYEDIETKETKELDNELDLLGCESQINNIKYRREYYLKHREKCINYSKNYAKSHKEHYNMLKKEWYQRNKERVKKERREYYKNNIIAIRKYGRNKRRKFKMKMYNRWISKYEKRTQNGSK